MNKRSKEKKKAIVIYFRYESPKYVYVIEKYAQWVTAFSLNNASNVFGIPGCLQR